MEGDQPVGSAFTSTCLITDRRTVDVTRTKFGSYDEQEDQKKSSIFIRNSMPNLTSKLILWQTHETQMFGKERSLNVVVNEQEKTCNLAIRFTSNWASSYHVHVKWGRQNLRTNAEQRLIFILYVQSHGRANFLKVGSLSRRCLRRPSTTMDAGGATAEKKLKKKSPTRPSREDLQKWKQTTRLAMSCCIGYHDPILPWLAVGLSHPLGRLG